MTDSYEYCIDTGNESACDGDNWLSIAGTSGGISDMEWPPHIDKYGSSTAVVLPMLTATPGGVSPL